MKEFHVVVVPVGKVAPEEVEAALARATKQFRQPFELRESLPVPQASLDPERLQHRAATMLDRLAGEVRKLKPGRLIGADDPGASPPHKPDAFVFVTDQDLFTAKTEGAIGALVRSKGCAVVSVRRLREAYYHRKADPNRQRARLVKEILRMSARLAGTSECSSADCVMAPTRATNDLDSKEERFCRACEDALFEGRMRL